MTGEDELPAAPGAAPADELGHRSPVVEAGQPAAQPGLGSAGAIVAVVVFMAFVARLIVSDHIPYWLDEIYSIYLYVLLHETLSGAIAELAATSIHPPLYQTALYGWIQVFGDGEIATRALSNLYIAVGTVFVFLLGRRLFGATTGVIAAIAFTLTPAAVAFGLEARSYAQTLMLVAASSYALVVWLEQLRRRDRLRDALLTWPAAGLAVANAALLLTHYFNFFVWAAQALFAAGYLVVTADDGRTRALAAVVANYLVQLAVFVVVWGRVFLETVVRRPAGVYATETLEHTALDGIVAAAELTYRFGPLSTTLVLTVALVVLAASAALASRGRAAERRDRHLLGTAYVTVMAALPAVVTFTAFALRGAERFVPRYFVFLVPFLTLAILVAAREPFVALLAATRRLTGRPAPDHLRRWGLAYGLAFVTVLVLPGTVDAATDLRVTDWRGTAEEVVAIVESDPEHRYAVYETSFRRVPVLDYYLARFSDEVRVDDVIRRNDEQRGEFAFEERPEDLAGFDYLIVAFIHHRVHDFPAAIQRLGSMFEVRDARIDADGGGIIVYELSGEGEGS